MGIALYYAMKTASGLVLPVEDDDFRDMSIAENMLHGFFFTDPTYLHERLWYNPLMPATDALISLITGLPLNIIVTQAGKYLNLLIPISLYFMCNRLFDKKIALGAAAASIFFVCGNDYGEHTSGYTYILISMTFSQIFFYMVVAYAHKTFRDALNLNFFLLGVYMGILFLFHSAPSFLLCLILICCFLHGVIKKELSFKEAMIKGGFFSVPFLLIASPLLFNIFIYYHYDIKNEDPMQWVYILFRPGEGKRLFQETVNIYSIIALTGLIGLIRSKSIDKITKRIILYWFFCSVILFFYVYSIGILKASYNISLPGFVPSCDIFFYVKSAEAVLFGIGIWQIALWVSNASHFYIKMNSILFFYAVICCMVILRMPGYAKRKEFNYLRARTIERQNSIYADLPIYTWMKNNTDINDVVLCKMEQANFPVMASGRKMVAAVTYYSNPYVSYINKKKDCDTMINGLRNNTYIKPLLDQYEVRYLLIPVAEQMQYKLASFYFPDIVYIDKNFILRKRSF